MCYVPQPPDFGAADLLLLAAVLVSLVTILLVTP